MIIIASFSLAIAIGAIFLGNYVLYKDPKNLLNRLFMMLCVSTGYQAFIEFEMLKANNAETAAFWMNLTFTWTIPLSFILHFVIVFTDKLKQIKPFLLHFIIYALPVFFSFYELIAIQWIPKKIKWGWAYVISNDPIVVFWSISTVVWSILAIASASYLCWQYYLRADDYRQKQQAKYVALGILGALIFMIFAFVCNELKFDIPTIIGPGYLSLNLFVGYAIVKYRLFVIGPESVARDVIATMSDFLFLVNREGNIFFANQAVLNNLKFNEAEVLGKPFNLIVRKEDEKRLFAEIDNIQTVPDTGTKIFETNLRTRSGQKIPSSLSLSLIKDRENRLQGIICIGRDITELKRAEKKVNTRKRGG
jgi:PAS domain S-box-containing protein